jgi:hypothetical protein
MDVRADHGGSRRRSRTSVLLLSFLSTSSIYGAAAFVAPPSAKALPPPSTGLKPLALTLIEPPPAEVFGGADEVEGGAAVPPLPLLAFPGGGLFFWWQAGFVAGIRDQQQQQQQQQREPGEGEVEVGSSSPSLAVLLERGAPTAMVGASAGALTAVLAKCDVDVEAAFDSALRLCDEAEVWTRPLGLAGKWGGIVREWLDELLPPDAADRCSGEVFVLVTALRTRDSSASSSASSSSYDSPPSPLLWPPLERRRVSDFSCREELIDACLASVHIPLFMDGRFFFASDAGPGLRGLRLIDGSFLSAEGDLSLGPEAAGAPTGVVDHKCDASLADEAFLQLKPGAALVRELVDRGRRFGERSRLQRYTSSD